MSIAMSIIIPVYNAEAYLCRGLDSCVNQTLQNIEIICVNDASTDNSGALIKKYADRYPNKVIQIDLTENSGQGGARNQGVLAAKGEYVCFLDSDDYLDTHLCEDTYAEAKRYDTDIVFYDYMRVEDGRKYPVELIGQEDKDLWYLHSAYAVWLQVVKREIILKNSLLSPQYIRAADAAITPLWKFYAKKSCKINKPYYYYINREGSLVNETNFVSVATSITGVIPYRHYVMKKRGLLDRYVSEADLMIARDISTTLIRLLKLKYSLTTDKILYMRRSLDCLEKHFLDESLMKYCLPVADINMVKDFLYCPERFAEKYTDYASFEKLRIELGMDSSIEIEIEGILSYLRHEYGSNIVIWGAGAQGRYIISTLLRMGYDFHIYDNARHGMEVWKGANKRICSFGDMKKREVDVVLVTSDIYYKVIENQIHGEYPHVEVVNFPRLLRSKARK